LIILLEFEARQFHLFYPIERKILDSIDEKEIIACLEGVDIIAPSRNSNNPIIKNNEKKTKTDPAKKDEVNRSVLPIEFKTLNEETKFVEKLQLEEYQSVSFEELKSEMKTSGTDLKSNRLSSQSVSSKRLRRTSDAQLDSREYPLCKICFTKELDAVLYNCGHRFCLECCMRMFKDRKRCPSCNRPILDAIRTYDQ